MKKLIPILLAILIIPVLLTGCNDRYNPFARKTYYYVVIKGEGTPKEDGEGNITEFIEYKLPVYNKEGKEKIITFTGSTHLREGTFLKIILKNESVKAYKEIEKENVPKGALEKMNI